MSEQNVTILVAEDEKPIAKALKLKLEGSGFQVDIVNNGQEAMTALESKEYQLLLLDLMMPMMDGFAVLEHMQKRGIKTPVIVSSNLSQEEDIARAKELGAKDYYVKSNTPISEVVNIVTKTVTG